ncbi:hypothetical protein R5H30_19250 [Sulfitobacter sp. D35]|uniref:hypothetical protein n=1 Tax=Sulfitobacter sp. D35 TaxID=3083252 RepID=UPI00296F4288|nr:hypothetical protein [Sulfitobacter sp. D35]MDW4500132.1 hypothetical protein [Sulfitobacter sp. D35]
MRHAGLYCLAGVLTAAMPLQAAAQSCPRQPLEAAWERASEAEETFVIVRGAFDFDPALNPEPDPSRSEPVEFTAGFRGAVMGPDGFDTPVALDLTVAIDCDTDACGLLEPGKDAIAFLREGTDTYVLETGPCGDFLLQPAPLRSEQRLMECFAGADCGTE